MTRPKPTVGQVLYSLNVGNAARRVEQVLTPVIVRKVGRKYFTCAPEGANEWMESEYHLDDWCEKTDFMANTVLFASEQEFADAKERDGIVKELRDVFAQFPCKTHRLTLETLRKIKELLV